MVLVALAGRSTANIIIALQPFVYTPIYIRLTRAEVLTQTSRGFVEAARAHGPARTLHRAPARSAQLRSRPVPPDFSPR